MVAHSRTAEYYRAWRAAHAEYRKRESQRAGVRKRAARVVLAGELATGRAAVRALDHLYPAIASRVIALNEQGEDRAAAAWNEEAGRIWAVLATDTAKRWLAESDAARAGADAGEGRGD